MLHFRGPSRGRKSRLPKPLAALLSRRALLTAGAALGLGAAFPAQAQLLDPGRLRQSGPRLQPEHPGPLQPRGLEPELTPRERLLSRTRPPRRLRLFNANTGESIDLVYYTLGRHDPEALVRLNRFLRDWRENAVIPIDPATLDIIHAIQTAMAPDAPLHVLSGYRTPHTNAMLALTNPDVAVNSLHMQGKAIDLTLPGQDARRLRDCAVGLQAGGVGYYAEHNFIHVDSGPVRLWG